MRRLLPVTREGWGCLTLIVIVGAAWGWNVFQNHFDGNRPLYDAIEAVDAQRVQQLLDGGADPNSTSRGFAFVTEFWEAWEGGEELGVYPEAPLVRAVYSQDEEIVHMLLHQGARTNVKTSEGYSILMAAAWSGQAAIVSDLLLKGAVPIPADERDPAAWAREQAMAPEIRRMLDAAGFPSPFAPTDAAP